MDENTTTTNYSYPLFSVFESSMRTTAEMYFAKKGYQVDEKYPFILADREDWAKNIIVPAVAKCLHVKFSNCFHRA